MKDNIKSKYSGQINPTFRYSQTSSNSSETSEYDYYLYCYSQGYKNREKGYWRGVLRSKNVDYDLRNNKEWNRRIELEDDDFDKTYYSSKKSDFQFGGSDRFSKEYITLVNDSEIGWDTSRFKKFQKYQQQNGIKKNMNREWIFSNGVKRGSGAEIRTQTYKQFEASEQLKSQKYNNYSGKNKEWGDNKNVKEEGKYSYGLGSGGSKKYDLTEKKTTQKKSYLSQIADNKKAINSTTNIKNQGGYGEKYYNKNIEISFTGKPDLDYSKKNIETESNYTKYKKQHMEKNQSFNFKKYDNLDVSKPGQIQGDKWKKSSTEKSYDRNKFKSPSPLGKPSKPGMSGGFNTYNNLSYASPVNKQTQKTERKEIKYGQNIERKQSYDSKGKPLSYLEKLNNINNKNKLNIDKNIKYGITSAGGRFDRSMEIPKRTSSYDSKEKIKKYQSKINETNVRKELRPVFSQDKQTTKYGQYTPGKSPYDKNKTQKSPKQTTYEQKKTYQKQTQKSTYVKTQYDTPKSGMQPRGKSPTAPGQSPSKAKGQTPTAYNSLSYKGSKNQDTSKKPIYDKSSYQKVSQLISSQTKRSEYDSLNEYNRNISKEKSKPTPYNKNKSPKSTLEITSKTIQTTYDKNKPSQSPNKYSQIQLKTVQSTYEKNKSIQSQQKQNLPSKATYDKNKQAYSPSKKNLQIKTSYDKSKQAYSPSKQYLQTKPTYDKNKPAYSPSKQNLQIQSKYTQSTYDKSKQVLSPSSKKTQIQSPYDKNKQVFSPSKQNIQIQSPYDKNKSVFTPSKQNSQIQSTYDNTKKTQSPQKYTQPAYDKAKKAQSPQKPAQKTYDKNKLSQSLQVQSAYDKTKKTQSPQKPAQSAYDKSKYIQSLQVQSTYDKTKKTQSPKKQAPSAYDKSKLSQSLQIQTSYDKNRKAPSPKKQTQSTYDKNKLSQSLQIQTTYDKYKQIQTPQQKLQIQSPYNKNLPAQSPKQTYTSQSRTAHTTYDNTKPSQSPKKLQIQTKTNKFTYNSINQTQSPKPKFKAMFEINKPSSSPKQNTQTQSQLQIKQTTYQKSKPSSSPSKSIEVQSKTIQSTYEKNKQTTLPKQKTQTQVTTKQTAYPTQSQKITVQTTLRTTQSTYDKNKPSQSWNQNIQSQSKTIQSTYDKNKQTQTPKKTLESQSSTMQTKYDKNKKQLTYGQTRTQSQYDITKYKSYMDRTLDVGNKKKDKAYGKRFDFDTKDIKLKNYRKQGSSYDKKKSKINGDLLIHENMLERPDNLVRLEISVEKKRSDSEKHRTPEGRKHETILFNARKKRKQSYDSQGKPLTNTRRLNDSQEKVKKQLDGRRLSNYTRIESSVESKHKEEKFTREPGERRHEVLCSNPKKKRQSYDKNGKPLTNTMRLNDSQEKTKKKNDGKRLSNYTRIESSFEKPKKDKRPSREPGERKNEVLYSGKKETKQSYDSSGRPIPNVGRINVSIEKNKEYVEKVDYNEDSYRERYNLLKKSPKSKTDITNKYAQKSLQSDSKKTPFGSYIQSIKDKDKDKKISTYQKSQILSQQKPQILSQQKSFVQQMNKKPGFDGQQKPNLSIDKNKSPYDNYPSSRKTDKNQQILTKTKTQNQFQYTKKFEKDYQQKSKPGLDGSQKPKTYGPGNTPEYKKYTKVTKIQQQKSFNKDIKTGSTYSTQPQKDLNKTIESSSLYYSKQKGFSKNYGTDSLKDSRQKSPSKNIGSSPYGTGSINLSIKTTSKYEKSDKINKSFDSPKMKDKSYSFTTDKYKASATDKNKYLQIQSSQPYKQPPKVKPFAQSSNLTDQKDLTKYYYPSKDSKPKYSPSKKSSSVPKSPKTDMGKKNDFGYKGLQTQTQTQTQTKPQANQKDNLSQYYKIQQGQKYTDKNKVGFTPIIKQKTSSYFKTEYTSEQKGQKPSDSKIIFTKYQQPKSPKGKDINKAYGSTSERKNYDYYQNETQKSGYQQTNISKQNISNIYQPKDGKKEKYTIQKITKGSVNEYNPLSKTNTFEYKPGSSSISKKMSEKKGLISDTSYGYKSPLNTSMKQTNSFFGTSYQNVADKNNKTISKDYNKYNKDGTYTKKESYKVSTTSGKDKKMEYSSKSYKKDKDKASSYFDNSKTKKTTTSELYKTRTLDEGMGGGRRNKSIQNTSYGPSGYGYGDDYGMAYFRLKFLTTKEVCEKFWKSIDDGELPISMFDPNRKSGSKYIKFFSPIKTSLNKYDNNKKMGGFKQSNQSGYY